MTSSCEPRTTRRPAPIVICFLVFTVAVACLYLFAHSRTITVGRFDLSAFYCAGRTLATGADPYRYRPMHDCEIQNLRLADANAVVPAPLPPLAIAAFIPLTKLPLDQANVVWLLILVASAGAVTWAVVQLTGLPFWLVGACAISALLVEPLTNGAMAPLPIALLCGATVAIVRARWTIAAVLLGMACIQPHVAGPPLLCALILTPPMRLRIAMIVGAVIALSLLAGGTALNLEYLTAVLPAHAASELGTSAQYSLSALLHLIGLPDHVALTVGSAQYALFVIAGIWMARLLKHDMPASVVLVPLAFAVTGGTFIHQPELAGALPLALVLASRLNTGLAWLGVLMLAIPWEYVLDSGLVFGAIIVLCAVLMYRKSVSPITAILAGLALAASLLYVHLNIPLHVNLKAIPPIQGNPLAEVAWKPLQDAFPPNAFWLPGHALTYLGLALVYWSTFGIAKRRTNDRDAKIAR